jgi:hypothetical protein
MGRRKITNIILSTNQTYKITSYLEHLPGNKIVFITFSKKISGQEW